MTFEIPGPRRKIGDRDVEIFTLGIGAPLLYLHSLDGIESSFPLLERLSERYQVIAPSHPGFGDSELPRRFSNVDDLAYHYLDLMEELNLSEAILVGASFGGWLAAEIAIKNLGRIRKLVLIDALGAKFASRETPEIADIFFETYGDVRKFYYRDPEADQSDFAALPAPHVARLVRNREALTLFGWSPHLHDPKLRQRLYRIKVPTLVLWGDTDRLVGPEYGHAYAAAIPGAKLETIRNAGHLAQAEQPDDVAARIKAFADS